MGSVSEITCIDDIINLPDVKKTGAVAKEWGVDLKGCGAKMDMHKRLIEYFVKKTAVHREVRPCWTSLNCFVDVPLTTVDVSSLLF